MERLKAFADYAPVEKKPAVELSEEGLPGISLAGGTQEGSGVQKIDAFGRDEEQMAERDSSMHSDESGTTRAKAIEEEVDRSMRYTVREETLAAREEAVSAREKTATSMAEEFEQTEGVIGPKDVSAGQKSQKETMPHGSSPKSITLAFGSFDVEGLEDEFQEAGNLDDADLSGILESREEVATKQRAEDRYSGQQKQAQRQQKRQGYNTGRTFSETLEWIDQSSFKDLTTAAVNSTVLKKCTDFLRQKFIGTLNKCRIKNIIKGFENGTVVESGQFTFAKNGASLMLMKYSGIDKSVIVPATVGGVPVQFLHPDFLSGGVGVLNNYRVRGVMDMMGTGDTSMLDTDDVLMSGFSSLTLPNTITMIFDRTFMGCRNLKCLCIPESVYYLDGNAFKHSKIQELYFNGACPKGFTVNPNGCHIYVRSEYEQGFRRCCL